MTVQVTQLNYYPVKSCAGIGLNTAQVNTMGFEHDREWAVLDVTSRSILTQRQAPTLCLIRPGLKFGTTDVSLLLDAEEMPGIEVAIQDGEEVETSFPWGPVCRGLDQGDTAANWLSTFLKRECRLLRFNPTFFRSTDPETAKRTTDQTAYADDFPFLLVSETSLQELNTHLEHPVLMSRFRPNIVVSGTGSFGEDSWKLIRIGDVIFDVNQRCGRCVITTVDQETAAKSAEPLKTLAKFRKFGNKLMFGMHISHHAKGTIALRDVVEVLE